MSHYLCNNICQASGGGVDMYDKNKKTTEVLPKKEGYDVTMLLCTIFLVITTLPVTLPFLLIMGAMITIL